jgi:hypothetical protein
MCNINVLLILLITRDARNFVALGFYLAVIITLSHSCCFLLQANLGACDRTFCAVRAFSSIRFATQHTNNISATRNTANQHISTSAPEQQPQFIRRCQKSKVNKKKLKKKLAQSVESTA